MKALLLAFLLFFSLQSHRLECRLVSHFHTLPTNPKIIKSTKKHADEPGKAKQAWSVQLDCFNSLNRSFTRKQMICGENTQQLKLTFIQNKKTNSSFVDLGSKLISYNVFNGLKLDSLRIRTREQGCEVWLESVRQMSIAFMFFALYLFV